MQINIIANQQPAFGRLITDKTIKDALASKKCPKTLLSRYNSIRRFAWNERLSSKDYVNIRLKYTDKDGFFGLISSKKDNHIPYREADCACKVSPTPESLENFKQWVNRWDTVFSENAKTP